MIASYHKPDNIRNSLIPSDLKGQRESNTTSCYHSKNKLTWYEIEDKVEENIEEIVDNMRRLFRKYLPKLSKMLNEKGQCIVHDLHEDKKI